MQENEFEKQVQQKMDEFKLTPSNAVWQKIEPQIRKEKKRRWILFFLPIILIGFLYGGYEWLNTGKPNNQSKQELSKKSTRENDSIQKINPGLDAAKNTTAVLENRNSIPEAILTKSNTGKKIKIPHKLKMVGTYAQVEGKVKEVSLGNKIPGTTQKIIENGGLSSHLLNAQQETILPSRETKTDSSNLLKVESAKDITIDPIKNILQQNNENVMAKPQKKKAITKHLWSWGFSLAIGKSGMTNNLLSSLFGSSQDKNLTSNFAVVPPPVTSVPIPTASLIKSSIAYITGVSVERKINKSAFIIGLNYKLFSTTNTTGTDSANYFRAISIVNTYHNYYHYIELPVSIKFQLAHLKKIDLDWSIGSSIAHLIGTNTLQFNSSTGLYYHDNSLLNKTQFGFNTALDFTLLSKQKSNFSVGPYFNYGITKIASQGYNRHHFSFIGLRTQIIFSKK